MSNFQSQIHTEPSLDLSQALAQVRAAKLRQETGKAIPAPKTCSNERWPPDYDAVFAWRAQQKARFELEPRLIDAARVYYKQHPVEFINHWMDIYEPRNATSGKLVWMPFILFDEQERLIRFILAMMQAQAPGLIEKSRDMGATWCCIGVTVWLWLFWNGSAIGWGSRKKEQVDKLGDMSSLFEKIRMAIQMLPPFFLPPDFSRDNDLSFMRCINRATGSIVTGEIGDDIGRGGRTSLYVVDEAAHLEHPEKVEASLLATTRCRIDISSVSGTGTVFNRKREAGQEWVEGQAPAHDRVNVFIMDWSAHPEKTKEWYKKEKARLTNSGLGHVFAREVDRDYRASVEGIIIPSEYVEAAIDAHLKLKIEIDPTWENFGGLDVADGGIDQNALVIRKGPLLRSANNWVDRDQGITTRKAIVACRDYLPIELQYDCIGVGAGVKTEFNRLMDENLIPEGLILMPWNAGAGVINPFANYIPGDPLSPKNRDFYENLKAQGWWELRLRFERTFRAIHEPDFTYNPAELIFIPSDLPLLKTLKDELSQATVGYSSKLKLLVNKQPEGTKSPNLADGTVSAYWPVRQNVQRRVSLFGPKIIR